MVILWKFFLITTYSANTSVAQSYLEEAIIIGSFASIKSTNLTLWCTLHGNVGALICQSPLLLWLSAWILYYIKCIIATRKAGVFLGYCMWKDCPTTVGSWSWFVFHCKFWGLIMSVVDCKLIRKLFLFLSTNLWHKEDFDLSMKSVAISPPINVK